MHLYEIRPRKDHRGFDLISDALPFGRLWYGEPNAASNAIGYAMHYSRSHDAVIRVYDNAGNVIETHQCAPGGTGSDPRPMLVAIMLTVGPFIMAFHGRCRSRLCLGSNS